MLRAAFKAVLTFQALVGIATNAGCWQPFLDTPPEIPITYYNCQAVDAATLAGAYYTKYMDLAVANARYNEQIFVFTNLRLTDKQVANLRNDGYIWVDIVKCTVANSSYCTRFKAGDQVDVVGVNKGAMLDVMGLNFVDCYIIPAGSIQLSAEGSDQPGFIGY